MKICTKSTNNELNEFTYNNIRQDNRNPLLLTFDGADGFKTGYTEAAGYGIVGSAEKGGRRLIIVLNGLGSSRSRAQESLRLMDWGFNNFELVNFNLSIIKLWIKKMIIC